MHHIQLLFTEFPTVRKCLWVYRCEVRVSLALRDHVEGLGRCGICVQIHDAISRFYAIVCDGHLDKPPEQLVRQVPLMDLRADRGTKGRGS